MATKRRGGLRPPELRGTLGTLLRTTTGVVRDALERGAREGRARLDDARANRRRHDALAELGELVLDLIRRGEIDLAELPEARDLVRQLDELDETADANGSTARGSGFGLHSLTSLAGLGGRSADERSRSADSRHADGSRADGRYNLDDEEPEPPRAANRSRFDDRASHASDFDNQDTNARGDDGTVSSITSATDRTSRPTVGARPATARPAPSTPSNASRSSSPALPSAAPSRPSSPPSTASARSSSSTPSTGTATTRPSSSTPSNGTAATRPSSPTIPATPSRSSSSAPPASRSSSSSPALPVPPPDADTDAETDHAATRAPSTNAATSRAPTKPIKGLVRPLIEDAPTVPERPDAKRHPLAVEPDRRGGISFDDDDLDDYMHPDDVPPRRLPGEPDDTSG